MHDSPISTHNINSPCAPVVLLCEHASNCIPSPLTVNEKDRPWLQTHWAWDIGVATVVKTISEKLKSPAVLANFSRLVCDPNRPLNEPTYIRKELEGYPLSFNKNLSQNEIERRTNNYYTPYHQAVGQMITDRQQTDSYFFVLSIHSFTPNYMGQRRLMEVGVLYDEYVEDAAFFFNAFLKEGLKVEYNQPWSGVNGMMFSPHKHGSAFGLINLELEIRQDLINTTTDAVTFGDRLAKIILDFSQWRFP